MSLINDMDFICGALFPFGGEAYDKAMAARETVKNLVDTSAEYAALLIDHGHVKEPDSYDSALVRAVYAAGELQNASAEALALAGVTK